jgi:hypothetical protein
MRKNFTNLPGDRRFIFLLAALLTISHFFCINTFAQGSMGRWQACGLTGSPATLNATGVGANLTFSPLSRGAGITAVTGTDSYVSNNWSTALLLSTGNNDYYEFTITPAAGFPLSIGAIKIRDRVSTTASSFDAYLRSSADNYATNLATWNPSTSITNRTFDLTAVAALQNRATAITFRIYGSDADAASTTYGIYCEGTSPGNFRGIDVDGTYKSQFISMNTGASTWCPGETRNVTVTIKNIGTAPWSDDAGKDFNIGMKWNTDVSQTPDSWPDYNVRVDAGNLAPGATATFTFPLTASNNAGGVYSTPLAAGTNNITFDIVYEGVSWFGDNGGVVGPGNAKFVSPAITIAAIPQGAIVGNTICSTGGTGQLTFNATAGTGPFTVVYNDGTANRTASNVSSGVPFNVFTNPSSTTSYTLISVASAAGCSRTSGFTGNTGTITINNPPVISGNPVAQIKCAGQPVTFSVTASGNSLTYQWRKGAGNITGATASSYTIAAVVASDAANYSVAVSTAGCTAVSSLVAALTVNARPSANITSASTAICNGGSTNITGNVTATGAWTLALSSGGGTVSGNGSGSFSKLVTPSSDASYTIVSLSDINCTSGPADLTGSTAITVNPFPSTVNASPASSAICLGSTASLTGSATLTGISSAIIDNFNGAPTFSSAGSSSGDRSQVWQQEISGANVNSVATFASPGGGNLMVATAGSSNLFGASSVNSILTSGTISTAGFSSLSTLTFSHTYKAGASGSGTFDVSTNGGSSWTTLLTFTSNVGGSTSFVTQSVNFAPYVNAANLKVRFNFVTANQNFIVSNTSWWAIDDVILNGIRIPLYSWTATTPAGVNGLPAGAGNPSTSNANIAVNPASTTSYTLKAANPVTGCSADAAAVLVTVYPAPTLIAPADADLVTSANGTGDCSTVFNWSHPVVNTNCPTTLTVSYSAGTPAPGSLPTGGTVTPGSAAAIFSRGVTQVTYQAKDQNNNMASTSFTVTVNDDEAPVITCAANVSVNNNSNACEAVVTLTAPTATDNCGVASVTNDHPSNIFPVGNTDVTWTALDNSGNATTCIQKVTVNDVQPPTIECAADVNVNNDFGICGAAVTLTTPATADNCGVFQTAASREDALTLSDIYPVGNTVVTWTVTDVNGNTASCIQHVIVTDNEKPSITCAAPVTTVTDAAASFATIILAQPTVADNCPGLINISNDHPSNIFPIGPTLVTWTAIDAKGNSNACTQTILVNDIIDPEINCNPPIAINNTPTTCDGNTDITYPTASDNSGHVTVSADYPGLVASVDPVVPLKINDVTFPVGTTTIIWTAIDPSLNDSWCTQTITVTDSEKPLITCPQSVSTVNDPGLCGAQVLLSVPFTSDNCGVLSVNKDYPSDIYPVGETNVTWTVTDIHNNINTCIQTVTVADNEKPSIAKPLDVNVSNYNGECFATITLSAPATSDNCGVQSVVSDHPSPVFPVGVTIVKWTVTDIHGNTNTSNHTVTVTDNELPVVKAEANITQTADAGACGAFVSIAAATATDNCGVGPVTGTRSDGLALADTYPVGSTTITWTVTDIHNNAAIAAVQIVKVTDDELPVITTSPNIAVNNNTGECIATVSIVNASAHDNCGVGTPVGTRSDALALTAPYPVGTTTIMWTVTDIHGNSAIAKSQTVTVTDNELPIISPATDITASSDSGTCAAILSISPLTASDNCGVGATTGTRDDGFALIAAYPVGTTTITWTVTDIHNNVALPVIQKVTIVDNEVPVITASADVNQTADAGKCGAMVVIEAASVTDNCGVLSSTGTRSDALALSDPYPVGTTSITWTATDIHNNAAVPVYQTVNITDNEAPVIYVGDDILETADQGLCGAAITIDAATAKDNCGVGATTGTRSDGLALSDPYPVGTTTITWSVTDIHGNAALPLTQNVTVTDNEAPAISVADINVNNDAGLCGASVSIVPAVTTDNCAVGAATGVRSDALPLTAVYPVGVTTIRWTVNDIHGNAADPVLQTITVTDNELPVIATCAPSVTVVPNNAGCTSILLDYRSAVSASDNCSGLLLAQSPAPGTALPLGPNVVTITATDASGNSSSCTFTVTVTPTLDVTVTNSNPQLYYGYSLDQSTVIKGTPTGGAAPYKIVITMNRALGCNAVTSTGDEGWVPSAGGSSVSNTCPSSGAGSIPVSTILNVAAGGSYSVTATLMANATFTITVTDKNGCTISKTAKVASEDARCFAGNSGNSKVKLCHRTGNANDPCHELCVDGSAVAAHLAHGDFIGACTPGCIAPPVFAGRGNGAGNIQSAETKLSVKVIPNPTESFFAVMINSSRTEEVRVRITDLLGRVIEEKTGIVPNGVVQLGDKYHRGVYFAEVIQGKQRVITKLLKL